MKPCIICGAKKYSRSFGGEGICPSCDCGNTIKIGRHLYITIDLAKRDGDYSCMLQGERNKDGSIAIKKALYKKRLGDKT